jgi:hypothetical protein
MSCLESGLKGFPIKVGFPIPSSLNPSIEEDLIMDISWGTKSVTPRFSGSVLEEGDVNQTGSQTSLRIQGNQYFLRSIQICNPLHTSFLNPAVSASSRAEIVCIFGSNGKYAILCIPIVAGSSGSPSKYLEALRYDALPGKPISLNTLLPEDLHYIHYTTCLTQIQSQKTVPVNLTVVVFNSGLVYHEAYITEIRRKIGSFPSVTLPDTLQVGSPKTIESEVAYKEFLRYGLYKPSLHSGDSRIRTDSTSAYKCVPLLPDQNVKDGQIKVDTEKGELLSQVLKDNNDIEAAASSGPTPADVERIIAIIFGISFGIFILVVTAYFIIVWTGDSNTTQNWPWIYNLFKQITPFYYAVCMALLTGFILGGILM